MSFNFKKILTPALFILLISIPTLMAVSGNEAASTPRYTVSTTLSPQAQGFWQYCNTLGKPILAEAPEPQDTAAWHTFFTKMEQLKQPANDGVIKALSPTRTPLTIGGVPVLEIKPPQWQDDGKVLVYLHGGGYTLNTAASSILGAAPLAQKTGHRVIIVDYKTAPGAQYEEIIAQSVSVIKGLQEQGISMKDVGIYGDSAGGGLATATLFKLRDTGSEMPAVAVLWSPWLDVTNTGETHKTLKDRDPVLAYDSALKNMALAYAPLSAHHNPYVSPLNGDVSKEFPPTLIQVGSEEILLSDSTRFRDKLLSAGKTVEFEEFNGLWHCFQVFGWDTPEGQAALQKTADFLKKHL